MILLGLGANLPSRYGSPPETLAAAIEALTEQGVQIIEKSRIWLTAPVPVSDQAWYHNAVVAVSTPLNAPDLLKILQSIENDFGRIRDIRNEPRVLDLDLLAYHDETLSLPDLTVPHPRLHERAFVLLPLQDIAADWVHPTLKTRLSDLIARLPHDQLANPLEKTA